MKNLKNRVREGNYFLYSFDLDQCYHPENCPPGYLVLYTIVKCDALPIEHILLDHWGDIHGGSIREIYSQGSFTKKFPSFKKFCQETKSMDMGPWLVKLTDGTSISGETDSIVTIFAKNETDHFAKIFTWIENDTFVQE